MSSSIAEALSAALAAASRKPKRERDRSKRFYASFAWRRLRYQVLEAADGRCMACGARAADGAVLNCDHIEPISKNWERRLDRTNLQVLCGECNHGKLNLSMRDWREPAGRAQGGSVLAGDGEGEARPGPGHGTEVAALDACRDPL